MCTGRDVSLQKAMRKGERFFFVTACNSETAAYHNGVDQLSLQSEDVQRVEGRHVE